MSKEDTIGQACVRHEWRDDTEIPVFTTDRAYIENLYRLPEREETVDQTSTAT